MRIFMANTAKNKLRVEKTVLKTVLQILLQIAFAFANDIKVAGSAIYYR